MLGPELIDGFKKPRAAHFFFGGSIRKTLKVWNFVARQREISGGFWQIFLFLTLEKGGILIHKNSLASGQLVASESSHAL